MHRLSGYDINTNNVRNSIYSMNNSSSLPPLGRPSVNKKVLDRKDSCNKPRVTRNRNKGNFEV